MSTLEDIFLKIKQILEEQSQGLLATQKYIGGQSKQNKPALHLYGTKEVRLFGKRPQKTYIAGVIQQKNYVSFYFSPVYSHPDDFSALSPDLKKMLKGKSCFNLNKITPDLHEEIKGLLSRGIEKYKELEWI